MRILQSDRFVSAAASGQDWRDAGARVLEAVQGPAAALRANIGFVYITDTLAADAESILGLLRAGTGISHWVGTVGLGVCGCGQEWIDENAIAVMAGRMEEGSFALVPPVQDDVAPAHAALKDWLARHHPMLGLIHGDPMMDADPGDVLCALERMTGAFLVGGLSSARGEHAQIAGTVSEGGFSGILFAEDLKVATGLSQGCTPLGPVHTVTRCDGHLLQGLDGKRAFDVFIDDLRQAAVTQSSEASEGQRAIGALFAAGSHAAPGADEVQHLFRGEVHVAFPVPGSDRRDYMVRVGIGVDADEGHVAIAHDAAEGDAMMFVLRDDAAMRADLIRMLTDLRRRVEREKGVFAPKGAIYISCLARSMADFGGPNRVGGEMALVQEVLGEVPLAGFYANGEISNHRLYGYTGIIILFHE